MNKAGKKNDENVKTSNDDTSDSGVASAMPQLLWVSLRFSLNGTYAIYSKHLK